MKNPGIVLIVTFFISIFWLTACHNYDRESVDQKAKQKTDSILRADSLKQSNATAGERELYQKALQYKIDSLQKEVKAKDSACEKESSKEQAKWHTCSYRIRARIERLKQRKEEVAGVPKDKWKGFKESVDTALTNIKYEWKNGE